MGTMELGAVLGRNQSFEDFSDAPAGWSGLSEQASFSPVMSASTVHSSQWGLSAAVESTGGDPSVFHYAYGTPGDLHAVWFPSLEQHSIRSTIWARASDAPSSGQARWYLAADSDTYSDPIAFAGALSRYEAQCTVTSQAGLPRAGLTRMTAAHSPASFYFDDALTQVDLLPLHPDWEFSEGGRIQETRHRFPQGNWRLNTWARFSEFRIPLRWISTSEAELINWWWEKGLNLVYTLDASDDSSVTLCRIVNPRQPIGRKERPYPDLWKGTLELSSINDGRLAF